MKNAPKTNTQLDRIEAALKRQDAKLDRILRAIRHHDLKADGEIEARFPWIEFDRPRRVQIDAVLEYLREHKGGDPKYFTIARACRETYTPLRHGYPNEESLKAYCYSLPITDFA